jgi:excisionase family DNA binding protein
MASRTTSTAAKRRYGLRPSPQPAEGWLRPREAARRLGIAEGYLARLLSAGVFNPYRCTCGGRLIRTADVQALLDARRAGQKVSVRGYGR